MDRDSELDLKKIIGDYTKHWKWFLLAVIIAVAGAHLHLRYTIPQYSASAKIQILEDKSAASELSVLEDLDIISGGNTKIEDEIELLKARSNFIAMVQKLELNIRYLVIGKLRDDELYGNNHPFNINFLAPDSIVNRSKYEFFVNIDSDTSFGFAEKENEPLKSYSFGSTIKTGVGDIILTPNDAFASFKESRIKVMIAPVTKMAEFYRYKMDISPIDKASSIVNISLTDPIEKRAIDIVNTLIEINNSVSIADKKAIADKTSQFIDDRIAEIYTNLSSVDESEETFRTNRGIADLSSQSNVNFNLSAASEQELQNANIQLSIAGSMRELINGQDGYDIIPEVGLADQGISSTAQRYNELVAQRNRLLESSGEKNPVVVKLDQQLEGLKKGMQSSLNNVTNNLNLQVNSLNKQLSLFNSRIYAAPKNARALRDISRRQQTTESLYLYLLQKREESQITFASASPKSKVVDLAYGSGLPVSPKARITYLAALMLGFFVPFGIIYGRSVLDTKIHNKLDLEQISPKIPVLAEIPKLEKKDSKLVKDNDRSILAESLRILRTNLDYIFKSNTTNKGDEDTGKTIFITSSVPGEGKTFISSNLSLIFANTGKKVLLLGADVRNPKLYNFFSSDIREKGLPDKQQKPREMGLTDFLSKKSITVEEITKPSPIDNNNIDVIYSGKIPPNPAELLMSNRLKMLFSRLRESYDYIIVDTAPLMVVTDTLLINQYADQILYVSKANSTEKKVLEFPLKLHKEGKLKGLSFIVNGVKKSNLGYGGKYGYGYGKTVKKWWNFFG